MAEPTHRDTETVLLIHGGDRQATALGDKLRSGEWRVIEAMDEIEALEAVRAGEVRAVVLCGAAVDALAMDLPGVLRGVSPAVYLPILVGVGEDAPAFLRCRLLDSGADDVVATTLAAPELLARLRRLLHVGEVCGGLEDARMQLKAALRRQRRKVLQLQRENVHLQDLAATDPLTCASNVRSFDEALDQHFRVARRYNHGLSLLMLDVDHFKHVNDTHGHPCGDFVLRELTAVLKGLVRESDLVARTGGEEFSIILPETDREQAARFAFRLREAIYAHKFVAFGRDIHITVSIGTATYPHDAEAASGEMLVYFADKALLVAKNSGRDRVFSFRDLPSAARRRHREEFETSQGTTLPTIVEEEQTVE